MSQPPHDEFLELCAIATTGSLTEEERRHLQEHLALCPWCREALRGYDALAGKAALAAGPGSLPQDLDPGPSWSLEHAESSFRARLEVEEKANRVSAAQPEGEPPNPDAAASALLLSGDTIWRHVWMQYAAALVLILILGASVYEIGTHRGKQAGGTVAPTTSAVASTPAPLEQQLSDAGHEREVLRAEGAQREQLIEDLRQQLSEQTAEIARLKEAQTRLEGELRSAAAGKDQSAQDRLRMTQQVEAAQAQAATLQQKLDSLARKSSDDATRATALEARITDLTKTLREHQDTVDQQEELLAHDRDIRELMGARDLYIAEVYDVAKSGATAKPYGRVFYTKGKSLIFYAYDLDQQKSLRNAKQTTFQAWGRRGSDWQQALSLGVFYEDNVAKKRWILRSNDPKVLAQIDAVFVTVEPNGGSSRPSNKPFLFAYLRIDANHP